MAAKMEAVAEMKYHRESEQELAREIHREAHHLLLMSTAEGVTEPYRSWKIDVRRGRQYPMATAMRLVEEAQRVGRPLEEAKRVGEWLIKYAEVLYRAEEAKR